MLLVLRPYGDWIRDNILAILDAGKISIEPLEAISEPITIPELVEKVKEKDYANLLVPFHGKDGRNGVLTLVALRRAGLIRPSAAIVMPVSVFAIVAFRAELAKQDAEFRKWFDASVCILNGPFVDHGPHIATLQSYCARNDH